MSAINKLSPTITDQNIYANCWEYATARLILKFFKNIFPELNIQKKTNCNDLYNLNAFYLNKNRISPHFCGDNIEYINLVLYIFIVIYLDEIMNPKVSIYKYDPLNKDPKHPSCIRGASTKNIYYTIHKFFHQISHKKIDFNLVQNTHLFTNEQLQLLRNFFNNNTLINSCNKKNYSINDFNNSKKYEMVLNKKLIPKIKSILDKNLYVYYDISSFNQLVKGQSAYGHSLIIIHYFVDDNNNTVFVIKNSWGKLLNIIPILEEDLLKIKHHRVIFIDFTKNDRVISKLNISQLLQGNIARPIARPIAPPIVPPIARPIAPPIVPPIVPPIAPPIAPPIVPPAARPIAPLIDTINLNGRKKCPTGYTRHKTDKTKCVSKRNR